MVIFGHFGHLGHLGPLLGHRKEPFGLLGLIYMIRPPSQTPKPQPLGSFGPFTYWAGLGFAKGPLKKDDLPPDPAS